MIRVLIVDDEPLMRIGIKSSIDWVSNGFDLVGEASNGKQALELINYANPDIVITDIKMPVMDGIELIKDINLNHPGIFSIVLSCHDDFKYVREAMKYGAIDYFIKTDLDPEGILQILNSLKDRIDKSNEKNVHETRDKRLNGEYLTFLKDNFIKDIIGGLLISERETIEKLKLCSLGVLEEKYVTMLIEIDNFSEVKEKYFEKDEKLLQFSIKNMLEELYGKNQGFNIFILDSREYFVSWSLHPDEMGRRMEEKAKEAAAKIIRIIKDYLNVSVSIGISNSHRTIFEVKEAYTECRKALEYKFIKGRGCIVYYSDIRLIQEQIIPEIIDEQFKNTLKFAVKSFDMPAINKLLSDLRESILNKNELQKGNLVKKWYLNLIELFKAFLIEEDIDVFDKANPYQSVLEAEDIFQVHSLTEKYCILCIEKALKGKEDKSHSYITKTLDYINNHYDSDISLQSVADKAGLNPSYFSRAFSKETGESFIDYLTKVRIEKSKQLLLKGFKAVEVAEKVGYPNYTYFSKLFKKMVGVNPSEFVEEKR